MTKSEEILKSLNLDYKKLTPSSFVIKPKNFRVSISIVLLIAGPSEFEMFIWDEDQIIKELVQFQIEENIGSIYSFLYEFKLKNCEYKTRSTRKN